MPTWGRIAATIFVWAMVPACLSQLNLTEGAAQVITVLILAVAATLTSGFIWMGQAGMQHDTARIEKAKRGASQRVDRLIDSLDEDDLAELRARLIASDGEMPVPLDSLLRK